jgi:3-oxoacyl-[acyl-carrier protein] reductase
MLCLAHTVTALSGKSIIVTGGSRGIGRAIAKSCALHGAIVGVNYLQSDGPAETLRERFPENVELLRFDVGDHVAVKRVMLGFIERHQGLDALVNNAGILLPHLLISQRDLTSAAKELRVNTLGTMNCTHIALPTMVKNKQGIIINISSSAVCQPAPGQASYAASKAAVEAFSRAIAIEYGSRNVRCICLRLGPVETDMLRNAVGDDGMTTKMPEHTLLKRLSAPTEIADIVRMLLSGPNALATGSILDFTAGYSL